MSKFKKIIFGFLFSFFMTLSIGVYAASTLSSSSVYYDKSTSGSTKTNVQDAIDDLYTKTKFISFKVGDYVKMTPAKTSFSVPMNLTGYTVNQPLTISELNLWRVIRLNSNGTVDMVSEYISSNRVHFTAAIGFQNYIGALNYIAKQYENPKYTVSSRYMGYNGQIEYLTDTSKINSSTAPWSYSTKDNTNESVGGGDMLYSTDVNLVKSALSTLTAYTVNTTTADPYWLGSRHYLYMTEASYAGFFGYGGRLIMNGEVNSSQRFWYSNKSPLVAQPYANRIRPIVTLGTNIRGTGSGTSASPYVLS